MDLHDIFVLGVMTYCKIMPPTLATRIVCRAAGISPVALYESSMREAGPAEMAIRFVQYMESGGSMDPPDFVTWKPPERKPRPEAHEDPA